jgi:hypothetical protein
MAKKSVPLEATNFGTGTWNDEEYLTLESVASGTAPSKFKRWGRRHLRFPISPEDFRDFTPAFVTPNKDRIAELLQKIVTGEKDPYDRPLDDRIKKIAADFQANGGSDWNVSIGIDRNQKTPEMFFVEVTNS